MSPMSIKSADIKRWESLRFHIQHAKCKWRYYLIASINQKLEQEITKTASNKNLHNKGTYINTKKKSYHLRHISVRQNFSPRILFSPRRDFRLQTDFRAPVSHVIDSKSLEKVAQKLPKRGRKELLCGLKLKAFYICQIGIPNMLLFKRHSYWMRTIVYVWQQGKFN